MTDEIHGLYKVEDVETGKIDVPYQLDEDEYDAIRNSNSPTSANPFATLDDSMEPEIHASSHEDTGSDELNVGGLSGELADPQPPKSHTHTASDVTDFDTEVENNTEVAANTAARHVHSNKAELDLVTDGDHDVRKDNPHEVRSDLDFLFGGGGDAHVVGSNTSYQIRGNFIFKGTDKLGIPSKIKVMAYMSSGTGSCKIYDLTNAQVIVEKTDITATVPAIIDLGTLSNLPSGEAMLEMHVKKAAPGVSAIYVNALAVQFD